MVSDPASPPAAVRLVAALSGGSIVDAKYFQTFGSQGSAISYTAGIHVKRTIYMSEAAKTASPEQTAIIEALSTQLGQSKWRVVHVEPPSTALASTFLALVDGIEKEPRPTWLTCRYAMCMDSFGLCREVGSGNHHCRCVPPRTGEWQQLNRHKEK